MTTRQNNPMNFKTILLGLVAMLTVVACKKEFDAPPIRTIPVGDIVTIADLRQMYADSGSVPVRFPQDMSLFATVTADEQSGNLYKNVFVQDATGALNLRLTNSGGLYEGDSIRIYLPGTILATYNQVLQLDSVNVDNNTVKQATQRYVTPTTVTLAQINPSIQSQLIRVENVEFLQSEACNGRTYADNINQQSVDRNLSDCSSTVIVRSSGYSSFAGNPVPAGNGTFIGIVGQFNSTMQLLVRKVSDLTMTGDRCDPCPTLCPAVPTVSQDFSSLVNNVDLSLNCWINLPQVGSRVWRGYDVSGNLAAQATAFGSGSASDIAWLISPVVSYTPGMTLSLRSQRGFGDAGHDAISVHISTDYDLSNLTTANWVTVPAALSTSGVADQLWVPSGAVDLGALLPAGYTGSFVIGFKYTGSDTNNQNTNIRIDDVIIQ